MHFGYFQVVKIFCILILNLWGTDPRLIHGWYSLNSVVNSVVFMPNSRQALKTRLRV